MNALEKLRALRAKDRTVRRWMKITGLLVLTVSAFFIFRNFTISATDDWFFGFCAIVGFITFILGWLPGKEDKDVQQQAISQYMRETVREKEGGEATPE